jgi:hypothetical protein
MHKLSGRQILFCFFKWTPSGEEYKPVFSISRTFFTPRQNVELGLRNFKTKNRYSVGTNKLDQYWIGAPRIKAID